LAPFLESLMRLAAKQPPKLRAYTDLGNAEYFARLKKDCCVMSRLGRSGFTGKEPGGSMTTCEISRRDRCADRLGAWKKWRSNQA
jgi:hypothetical protein